MGERDEGGTVHGHQAVCTYWTRQWVLQTANGLGAPPGASSGGGDFNLDFNVSFTEEQQREGDIEYNYERGGHAMDAAEVPRRLSLRTRTWPEPT